MTWTSAASALEVTSTGLVTGKLIRSEPFDLTANTSGGQGSIRVAVSDATGAPSGWTTSTANHLPPGLSRVIMLLDRNHIYLISWAGSNPRTSVAYFATISEDGSLAVLSNGSIWQQTEAPPNADFHVQQVTSAAGCFFRTGGEHPGAGLSAEAYFSRANPDGSLAPWRATTQLPDARTDFMPVAAAGMLHAVGGRKPSGFDVLTLRSLINGDCSLGSWEDTSSAVGGIYGQQPFSLMRDGVPWIYAPGGYGNGGRTTFGSVPGNGRIPWQLDDENLAAEGGSTGYNEHLYFATASELRVAALGGSGDIGPWIPRSAPWSSWVNLVAHDGFMYAASDGTSEELFVSPID